MPAGIRLDGLTGGFRSNWGAEFCANVRSVIGTATRQGVDVGRHQKRSQRNRSALSASSRYETQKGRYVIVIFTYYCADMEAGMDFERPSKIAYDFRLRAWNNQGDQALSLHR